MSIEQIFRNPGNFGMEIGNTPLVNAILNAFDTIPGVTGYTGYTGSTGPSLRGQITGQYLVWDSVINNWVIGSHYGPSSDNTNLGTFSMNNRVGSANTAIGYASLQNITGSSIGSIAIGNQAGMGVNTYTGSYNILIGVSAGSLMTGFSPGYNIGIGGNRVMGGIVSFTGSNSIGIGNGSFGNAVQSVGSICIGANSGNRENGVNNVGIGHSSLNSAHTGMNNICLGFSTGSGGINSNGAICIGTSAGSNGFNTNGVSNVIGIGNNAATTLTNGGNSISNAIGIGNGALSFTIAASSITNIISIGITPVMNASGSNQIIISNLGRSAINTTRIGFTTNNASSQTGGCFIDGIYGSTITSAGSVLCGSTGMLGTISSSIKYKENINTLTNESDLLYTLKPVSFNYKIYSSVKSYGLIAEEVNEIMPELVVRNLQGEIDTVQYHLFPALLLNELKKIKNKILWAKNIINV